MNFCFITSRSIGMILKYVEWFHYVYRGSLIYQLIVVSTSIPLRERQFCLVIKCWSGLGVVPVTNWLTLFKNVRHKPNRLSSPKWVFMQSTFCSESLAMYHGLIVLYSRIYIHNTNICRNIGNNNDELQWKNEHFFIKIYLSHFILERVMFLVCEGWAGDGDRLLFWPKVLLSTIAALLPHLDLVTQPWVTEGPKPSVCRFPQFGILSLTYPSRLCAGHIIV